jgi:ABC-type nickel/cobalt efflux system permease component RcnA
MTALLLALALGALLGARHAFEPDHVAAVALLTAENRSPRRAALLGAIWGLGHTIALLAAAAVLSAVGSSMPPLLETALELGVAVMLVVLGVRGIWRAVIEMRSGPAHVHHHGLLAHRHAGAERHVHLGPWAFARRPLLIGLLHGLAGSGALAALVAAKLPALGSRLIYVLCFGAGSILGMAALSGAAGLALARLVRGGQLGVAVRLAAASVTLLVGAAWGAPLVSQLLA